MIDVHSHILPGVDHGAADMEETIAMLKYAINDGITAFIATPHYHLGRRVASYDQIEKAYSAVLYEVMRWKSNIGSFETNLLCDRE